MGKYSYKDTIRPVFANDIEAPDYRESKEFGAFKRRVESVLTNRPQTVGAILKKIGKGHQAWLADALEMIATKHEGYLDTFTKINPVRRFEKSFNGKNFGGL